MFLLLCSAVYAQFPEVVSYIDDVRINWTQMRIEILGYSEGSSGSIDWKEGTACRSITEQLKTYSTSLPITAQDSLYELLQSNAPLEKKILRGVNNWQTYETRYFSESDEVEVLGHLNLHLYLQPLLLEYAKVSVPPTRNGEHTGLVIDSRGFQFSPVVLPEVLKNDGTPILSAELFSNTQARSKLPVRYAADPAEPLVVKTAGKNPLSLQIGSTHEGKLVLDPSNDLPSAEDIKSLVARGNVIIIVDP